MDENLTRIVVQMPEDMVRFLERLAARQNFKTRSKAIRFCIRGEMKETKVR